MKLERQLDVSASPEDVWRLFWDIQALASCIPGCKSARALDETGRYAAVVEARVGRFRVEFELAIDVIEVEEGQAIKARVQGTDRHTRSTMVSDLDLRVAARDPGGAVVWLENELQIYGKLGSLGHGVVSRRGEHLMDEFAENVRARLEPGRPEEELPPRDPRPRVTLVGGALVLVAAVVVLAVVVVAR